MGKSTAFIGVYSMQFEFGPISEASIGNVGRHPATRGWVDHVVTPVMGFALMAAEDALDRYFVMWFEEPRGQPGGARDHPHSVQSRAADGQSCPGPLALVPA